MILASPTKPYHGARRRWRAALRWFVLVSAVALAWPLRSDSVTSVLLPALSPFVGICSALATRAVGVISLFALPVIALAAVFPRWFCHYACPAGLLQELLERFHPAVAPVSSRVPPVGKWLVAVALGGACIGNPLFLWLDPLALFNGFLTSWRGPLVAMNLVAGLGLPLLLLFNVFFPRVWCQRLCPLGASQELLAWPRQRLRRAAGGSNAVTRELQGPLVARRMFLGGCAGVAGVLALNLARGGTPSPLRPPGALGETQFTGVCLRCGNCAQACPARIIHPDFGASGVAGFLSPVLRFDSDYCHEDCYRCGQVCPSGALERLPLERKSLHLIGMATVNLDTCLLVNGRECTACIRACPYAALSVQSADGGFLNEPVVDRAKCNGCGACEAVCPVRPERSIRVSPHGSQ